ncbi:MAG: hypothetical protein NUK65_12870, partial [Firmicutes bacterium]|nr:hypothetical protein [Bacillota bacterium]
MTNAKKRLTPPVLELLQYYLHKTKHSDLSMRNKLFLFLVVFVVLLILGIFLLFVITGTIVPGVNVIHQDFKKDLNTAAYDIATQYGTLSAHAVEFANELSTSIEQKNKKMKRSTA